MTQRASSKKHSLLSWFQRLYLQRCERRHLLNTTHAVILFLTSKNLLVATKPRVLAVSGEKTAPVNY